MAGFFVCAVAIPRAFIDTGLLIVVLGESVVAVGFGVSDVAMDPRVVSVAVLGLVLSAELWWIYFATDEDQAKLNMRDASVSQRLRMAVFGYFYAFSGVLLGVTVLASGVRLTIGGILDRLPLAPALLLAGGVALFLLGDFLFRKSLQIAAGQSRFVAAAVALLTVPLGMYGAGIAEMIGLIATLAVMLLFEPRRVA